MATDYSTQPDHVEADRYVEVSLRIKTHGSSAHCAAIVQRVQRMLAVELHGNVEVLAWASAVAVTDGEGKAQLMSPPPADAVWPVKPAAVVQPEEPVVVEGLNVRLWPGGGMAG